MDFRFAIAGMLALSGIAGSASGWCADASVDEALVQRQALSIPALHDAAFAAATSHPAAVELKSAAHQITIVMVNSKLNSGDPAARGDEAGKIVYAVEKKIAAKKEFAQVMSIHVDFVRREADHSDIVQGFDFMKSPGGSFTPHKT